MAEFSTVLDRPALDTDALSELRSVLDDVRRLEVEVAAVCERAQYAVFAAEATQQPDDGSDRSDAEVFAFSELSGIDELLGRMVTIASHATCVSGSEIEEHRATWYPVASARIRAARDQKSGVCVERLLGFLRQVGAG